MGASASMCPDLPEQLGDEDIQRLAGKEYYNLQGVINSFKNDSGTVDTQDFMLYFGNEQEREVYHLYENYCTKDGLLSQYKFVSLCREAKFLHKTQYSSADATSSFMLHCNNSDTINYCVFRKRLLPDLANGLGLSLDEVLAKLAVVEVEIDFDSHGTNVVKEQVEANSPAPPRQDVTIVAKAALKLQSFQRRVNASRQFSEMMEDRRIEKSADDPSASLLHPEEGSATDEVWTALFAKYAPNGEFDAADLVHLCRDVKLMNKHLTSTSARLVFNRARAICESPACNQTYREGLIFKKRVNYAVFRDVLIPLLLERRRIDTEEFTDMTKKFLEHNPKAVQRQKTYDIVKACF